MAGCDVGLCQHSKLTSYHDAHSLYLSSTHAALAAAAAAAGCGGGAV